MSKDKGRVRRRWVCGLIHLDAQGKHYRFYCSRSQCIKPTKCKHRRSVVVGRQRRPRRG